MWDKTDSGDGEAEETDWNSLAVFLLDGTAAIEGAHGGKALFATPDEIDRSLEGEEDIADTLAVGSAVGLADGDCTEERVRASVRQGARRAWVALLHANPSLARAVGEMEGVVASSSVVNSEPLSSPRKHTRGRMRH